MFRRSKSENPASRAPENPAPAPKPGGKGRPTPTRKEAEAARLARVKTPRTRKEMRQARYEASQKVRQAMKSGDERYFLPRDRGPVRRFVRDFVDSRFSFLEIMLPLALFAMVLNISGNTTLMGMSSFIMLAMFVLLAVDVLVLRFRLRREIARRFPGEEPRGTTYYAVTRALQMKFMRLPKPRVKIGEKLPDTYR